MKIALLGFGVVGRGVYDLTKDREDISVSKVLCLEDVRLHDAEVTRNFRDIVEDETIDTVVECMGGLHPAFDFVKEAVLSGKNIVTSNKALVATFYDELLPLVAEKGVLFRCTAAVVCTVSLRTEKPSSRRTMTPAPAAKAILTAWTRSTGLEGAVGTRGLSSFFRSTFWNAYSDTVS